MSNNDVLIHLEDLGKVFYATSRTTPSTASICRSAGEFLSIEGFGCGKSTLLSISGFLDRQPPEGTFG